MPRSGLVTTTVAPEMAAPEGSFTVPVIEPVFCDQAAAQRIRTNEIPNNRREDFIVIFPKRRGRRPAWFSRLCRASPRCCASNRVFHIVPAKRRFQTGY